MFSNASLEIVQEPQVPEGPSNVSRLAAMSNILALGGAAVMAVIVILSYLFRFTVKIPYAPPDSWTGRYRDVNSFEEKNGIKKSSGQSRRLLLSFGPW